jgi:hypothetical protein
LKLDFLEDWIGSEIGGIKFVRDDLDNTTAREVRIMPTGGFPLTTENAIARPTYQILARDRSYDEAEALASEIDFLIVPLPPLSDQQYPKWLGPLGSQLRVLSAGRVGGDPAPVERNSRGWATFSCNYWLSEERG